MEMSSLPIDEQQALDLEKFKEMDYFAVEKFNLPIELMMENAGLQLAKLISHTHPNLNNKILIGIGNGNNGGGGLVAARRLAAWGYEVYLDLFTEVTKELPKLQLARALKFGVKDKPIEDPELWVDAYLGFSQKLPLPEGLLRRINQANTLDCQKISLDIPTGYLGDSKLPYFKADKILTLAALKKILLGLAENSEIYVADLGIPKVVYQQFGIQQPKFKKSTILHLKPSLV